MAKSKERITRLGQASLIALTHVLDALAPFSDYFVLVGGWAPYLLLQKYGRRNAEHVGSADLDLVFDGPKITPEIRNQIVAALEGIGCQQRMWDDDNNIAFPDSYWMPVKTGDTVVQVQVDVMGLERVGRRRLESQYALALKRAENIKVKIGKREVKVPVSGAAAVFAMKAIALADRNEPKDAYDIYMLTRYYGEGPSTLAAELKPLLIGPPFRKGLANVRKCFKDVNSPGPLAVAEFVAYGEPNIVQQQLREEAYLTMKALLDGLKE